MRLHGKVLAYTAGTAFLLAAAAVSQAQELGVDSGGKYTAQRRPRIAVFAFNDTNTEASKQGFGLSVAPMLATFLNRESQFAVVERQDLGALYKEKERIQRGLVHVPPEDAEARELLKKIDAFIIGNITVLDGSQVEIDAKLLTGFDAEVVATSQESGPATCLRSIVDRLGVALEQEFLRPHYGKLKISLREPENVRIYLTPIPLDTAPDEESPQAERSSTVTIGGELDTVEPWITDPASYTIEGLLSGWYSMRLARPGYEDLKTEAQRFEVRHVSGKLEVYDRTTGLPLSPELRRFVVHVDPLATQEIDGGALKLELRKKGGSPVFLVKRQFLDTDFTHSPQRVILVGADLDLNSFQEAEKPAIDRQCNLLREPPRLPPDYGRTFVASGKRFDFDGFPGGELIIEDYKGETIPSGRYKVGLWDPYYPMKRIDVTVRDGDPENVTRTVLARETVTLNLDATGPQPGSRVILKGRETHYQLDLPLDFTDTKEKRGLPADTYTVSTNVPGLDAWRQTLVLLPGLAPPRYYPKSPAHELEISRASEEDKKPFHMLVKTRFVLAGRIGVLSRPPDPSSAALFVDGEVGNILDRLLQGKEPQPELLQLLSQHLEAIDLLVLDSGDMAQVRKSPELAAKVEDYVKKGGALFAFVTQPGDYGQVVGAPLVIEAVSKPTDRFDLAPGEVTGILPRFDRKVDVKSKRALPELSELPRGDWRVIAFTQERENPRIMERGRKEEGGYVILWFDDPGAFRDQKGRTESKTDETRGKVEERAVKWARYLMYRRYDKSGKMSGRAAEGLGGR